MKKWRRLLCLCTALSVSSYLQADTLEPGEEIEDNDIQALREWLNTKRQVTVKEKGGALSISGEVRTELQSTNERRNGVKQRGVNSATGLPTRAYDVEFNLLMDYRTDRTWASVKVEFDEDAGVFSGTLNKLKLERAYFGVRMLQGETYTSDVEIGRRQASAILDSKVEFDFFFDGVYLRWDQSFEGIADSYLHMGVFVINDFRDHYGYVGELGFLDIADTGLYTKYSLIDWDTKHYPDKDIRANDRFRFLVSQLILGYKFMPQKIQKIVKLYLAGVYNHLARKLEITNYKRANYGGYIGFSMGELRKKGDWSFDANYQVLAAQAVPDFDAAGVGLGNANRSGFYTTNINGTGKATTRKTAGGNTNFRGYSLTLEYLLSENLNLYQAWRQAITLDDKIGPFRRYKQYEIEFIYGF